MMPSSLHTILLLLQMPISGVLCTSLGGWMVVYYIHALLTLILMLLWWFAYR